ncbi:MAG: O-antigen ligase family protein [Chitinophagales bacterium]|nr:O-antigen ligase family protein [Chitinophagales bacterium]
MTLAAIYQPAKIKDWLLLGAVSLLVGFAFYKVDSLPILFIVLAAFILGILSITRNLKYGFYLLLYSSFFSVGLTRYLPGLPLGLLNDFLLVIMFLVMFFQKFKDISWKPLHNAIFLVVAGWMVLNIMEIVNPESRSIEAWFYAMRGVSLYFFLTVLMGMMYLNHDRDFHWFIKIWFVCSIIGSLWGLKQLYIGLDEFEKAWLSVPGNLSTHVLFGKLRVFSFYSDAGQFGASQAHTSLVAGLLATKEKRTGRKLFYLFTFVMCLLGMLISGTRGAIAIPVIGIFSYFLLIRNWRIVIVGGIIAIGIFVVLKYTSIGQGIYQINRLRTALNPNDASFQVRLDNQARLAKYLNSHPFGGGIGSAGYWGQRFSPNTFLANLALDSWYVRIAAEFGYFGLFIYLGIVITILVRSALNILRVMDEAKRNQLIAIFSGLSGIMVASYTNQVFGQMPTGILIYISIVFLAKALTDEKATTA